LSLVQDIASPAQQLFPSACPYNAAYYNMYSKGDGLGWHFDKGEFGCVPPRKARWGRACCGLRVEEEQKEEVGAVGHAVGMPTTLLTYTRVSIRVAPCWRAMACDGLVPVARVNLILQESEAGGNFEYHHRTRDSTDAWAFDEVGRILAGDRSGVSTAGLRAGSLVIFSGR